MDYRNARITAARVPAALLATALAATLGGCTVPAATGSDNASETPPAVRAPENGVLTLDSDDPAELALHASQALFERSPVVVVTGVDDDRDRATAAATGEALAAPVLLDGGVIDDDSLRNELERLGTQSLVVVGSEDVVADADALAGDIAVVRFDPDAVSEAAREAVESVSAKDDAKPADDEITREPIDPAQLADLREKVPEVEEPDSLSEVMLLIDPAGGQEAAIGTARAAGAVPASVPGGDPGARQGVINTIATADPLGVIAIGPGFDDEKVLAWQVEAARTFPAFPHGTQRLAGATYTAVEYTAPEADPETVAAEAAVVAAEAEGVAAMYGATPVVSVVANVRSEAPGTDGDYAEPVSDDVLTVTVEALRDAGVLVLLDVVPGTRPLGDHLDALEPLLARPGVGVALHPEFRLVGDGTAVPGQVTATELQGAVDKVAQIVTQHGLPQAMVVVHQSASSSVTDRETLKSPPQTQVVFAAAGPGDGGTTATTVWYDVATDLPPGTAAGWSGPSAGTYPPSDPSEPLLIVAD